MFVSVYRSGKFAFQNFKRNIWLSLITIFILVLTLLTISLVVGVNLLAQQALQAVQAKVNINIYFMPKTQEQTIVQAENFLRRLPAVQSINYISPAQALKNFKQAYSNNPDVENAVNALPGNPLPPTLVVQAKQLKDYNTIMQQFQQSEFQPYIQKQDYVNNQTVIQRLSSITTHVYEGGIVISAIFVLISMIMMFNTIRVAIYAYREELMIMKLVGATNWFIRAPFILEGILYAIFSSCIAMLLVWLTVLAVSPAIDTFFSGYNFSLLTFFSNYFWYIFAIQFIGSVVLAVGSSMISIGRYLRV